MHAEAELQQEAAGRRPQAEATWSGCGAR